MAISLLSKDARQRLFTEAAVVRSDQLTRIFAAALVITYNFIGYADITSTNAALAAGVGEEANPFMRAAMVHFGPAWMVVKLALQALITVMVLWYPHRFVLAMFAPAVIFNAYIVTNNASLLPGG